MLKVLVASANPVKVRAAMDGFSRMFPDEEFVFVGLKTSAACPSQPVGDMETLECARQRAVLARESAPENDYWIGLEGGVSDRGSMMEAFAWIVILSREGYGQARTGTISLPNEVAALVRGGMELGEADDLVFQRNNSKQENGAVGLLTGDVITRQGLYSHAVILALIPFRNPTLYP